MIGPVILKDTMKAVDDFKNKPKKMYEIIYAFGYVKVCIF